ncbi:MAG TPA: efflux RND transporter periplasmic adaptor subunit [Gemmatimonadaceae bacterium]
MHRSRIPASLTLILIAACGRGKDTQAAESTRLTLTPSDVVNARVVSLTDAVAVSGPLDPAQTLPLKAQINAIVKSMRVDRGSRVKRGDTLVVLEAQGLHGLAAGAKAAVDAAEANLALATQRQDAARRMHASGGISDDNLRSVEAARASAEAQAAAARAQLATAQENESRAAILSPISGIVSDRSAETGEAVKDGGLLVTVVDTRTLQLNAQVSVDEAMRVRPGATVLFTLDAVKGETFHGRVLRIDPRADPATRQVGVASELPNEDLRIVAGQFAHGRVLTGTPAPMVAVPITAVTDSSGHAHVFVVASGRLKSREVTLGPRDDDLGMIGIRSGLQAGERVLSAPVVGAAEGLAVAMSGDTTTGTAVQRGDPPATKGAKAP